MLEIVCLDDADHFQVLFGHLEPFALGQGPGHLLRPLAEFLEVSRLVEFHASAFEFENAHIGSSRC